MSASRASRPECGQQSPRAPAYPWPAGLTSPFARPFPLWAPGLQRSGGPLAGRPPPPHARPKQDSRGSKKGQKMAIFDPLRRKVQGEWGGSAHSPDPTAQSAPRPRAPRPSRAGHRAAGCAGLWGWLGCSACGLVLLCDWSSDWNRRKAGASHLSRWSESSPPMVRQRTICSDVPARRVRIDPHILPARCCIRRVSSVLTMLSHRSASRRADATLCRMRRLAARQ